MRDAGVTHFTVHPHRYGNDAEKTIELLRRDRTSSSWRSAHGRARGSIGFGSGGFLIYKE